MLVPVSTRLHLGKEYITFHYTTSTLRSASLTSTHTYTDQSNKVDCDYLVTLGACGRNAGGDEKVFADRRLH
jgi:hypothetical protein